MLYPNVTSIPLPPESALYELFRPGDFLDCYAAPTDQSVRDVAEAVVDFPGWTNVLMQIRRFVTAPFGLINDLPEVTEKIGPFPIVSETDQEIVAGFDDKHLDFRVSVMVVDGYGSLATWVRPHNLGGRLYLRGIMPFHVLVVRNAVARATATAP